MLPILASGMANIVFSVTILYFPPKDIPHPI